MKKYNLINTTNSIESNYDVSAKDISLRVYVSPIEEVCIVGELDNNYICWCSITNRSDIDANTEIINYILSKPQEKKISSKYHALGARYSEVKNWHYFSVSKQWYQDHYRYRSPVSNCFLGDSPHNHGVFLANEIQSFFQKEQAKCHFRLIDDGYVTILRKYYSLLIQERNPEYYHIMQPVITILENESYLKLCPVEEVRQLYLQCLGKCSDLYNTYMTAVR